MVFNFHVHFSNIQTFVHAIVWLNEKYKRKLPNKCKKLIDFFWRMSIRKVNPLHDRNSATNQMSLLYSITKVNFCHPSNRGTKLNSAVNRILFCFVQNRILYSAIRIFYYYNPYKISCSFQPCISILVQLLSIQYLL